MRPFGRMVLDVKGVKNEPIEGYHGIFNRSRSSSHLLKRIEQQWTPTISFFIQTGVRQDIVEENLLRNIHAAWHFLSNQRGIFTVLFKKRFINDTAILQWQVLHQIVLVGRQHRYPSARFNKLIHRPHEYQPRGEPAARVYRESPVVQPSYSLQQTQRP